MNTQKAAYWLALAVFGLALHSEYRHGSFPVLHRAADCATSTFYRIATHVEQTFAMASPQTVPPALRADDLGVSAEATELAEGKAELARAEAQDKVDQLREQAQDRAELLRDQALAQVEMIRTQLQLQRAQIHRCVRSQLRASNAVNRRIVVVCPRTRAKVRVHRGTNLSDLATDLSDIEIGDSF